MRCECLVSAVLALLLPHVAAAHDLLLEAESFDVPAGPFRTASVSRPAVLKVYRAV